MRSLSARVSWLLVLGPVLSCSSRSTAPSDEGATVQLTATIQDLMDSEVDPSADVIWASVASITSEKGFEERQPRTDEEWREVRRKAITLVEATNLLVMNGRRVSSGYVPSHGAGELDSTGIQKKLDASPDAFRALAHVLDDAGQEALRAIEAKNPEQLLKAGGDIDAACEACHVTYWYPDFSPSH